MQTGDLRREAEKGWGGVRRVIPVLAMTFCAFGLFGATASASTTPPTIESEWVTGVTEHNAVLHATINPNGTLTKYKLQFDESGTFQFYQADCGVLHVPGYAYCAHVTPGDERIEPPEGSIPAGSDAVEVSVDLASIGATVKPNTTYYYRAIAANSEPGVEGPTQSFTTELPPPGPPTIESESVSGITQHNAVLEAVINPGGLETTYQFQLQTEPCGGVGVCQSIVVYSLPSSTLLASSEDKNVSLDLNNDASVTLTPGVKYRYSVTATNTEDEVNGQWHEFEAPYPPTIESETVSNVTPTDATLEAAIDPQGAANGVFYQFQLLLDPGEAPTEIACPSSPPSGFSVCVGPSNPEALPLGWIPGNETQTVSLDLSSVGVSLEPGRTYFFRVLAADRHFSEDTAEWEPPAVVGDSESFTTPLARLIDSGSQTSSAAGGSQQTDGPSPQLIPKQGGRPKVHCKRKHRLRHRHKPQRVLSCGR